MTQTSKQYICTVPCGWAQLVCALTGEAKRLYRGLLGLGRVVHSWCWAVWPCRKNLGSLRLSLARQHALGWENNSISCYLSGVLHHAKTP